MVIDLLDDGLLDIDDARGAPARSNRDLEEWAKGSAPTTPTTPADRGACHVCRKPARGPCQGCGRPACSAHTWIMFGLCTECASEDRIRRWNQQGRATGGNWLEED